MDSLRRFPFPLHGLLAAVFLLTPLAAAAQTEPTEPTELAENTGEAVEPSNALKQLSLEELFDLEITSVSRKPEASSRTAAAVHVVTSEDIHRMGVISIPEALRYIPGVEVARSNSRNYSITARGFNGTIANKLLVLIDGRSVYTPLYSGVFWDAQDTFLEDIEQIEVIRGPGATVWGANAVNGVINVISKSAANTQGFIVDGGAGNVERGFVGARYGGRLGSQAFFRVYAKDYDRGPTLLPNGQESGDAARQWQTGFRADWARTTADGITLQGDLLGGSIDQPGMEKGVLSGGNVLGKWTKSFSDRSNLQTQVYYDRTKRDNPTVFGETLDTYDVTLNHRFAPAARHDLVWGLGWRFLRDDVRNSASLAFLPPRLDHRLYTGFVQDEVTLSANRLFLTMGSKIEHNSYTGYEVQPGVRLAWTLAPTKTLWAAASRAVRTPSRIDRDFFAPAQPPYLIEGDSTYQSEVVFAYELGYKGQPTGALSTSISTFYNVYDKLRSLEFPPIPGHFGNGLEGEGYGVEAEATCQLARGWRVNAGYTFLRLILDVKPGSTDTQQESQERDSPRHQAYLRSSVDLPHHVSLDTGVRYADEIPNQQIDPTTICDARLAWKPVKQAEISVVGQGLFDTRHPEWGTGSSRREVERSIYGKATCRF